MITVLHHEADRVIAGATRVLRELSGRGLLSDVALVRVGDTTWTGQPPAICVRDGEDTPAGLFDALADDPAAGGNLMTAVASAGLEPQAQLELAETVLRTADRLRVLAGVRAVASCLFVPESRQGGGVLPAQGFFSARTVNFVALPADWRFVDRAAVAVEFSDADRSAWHAALEIATLTSAWRATAGSRWQPEILSPGVSGHGLRFVRSAARLVTGQRSGPPSAEDALPVPDGFSPAPVPELVERTVAVLHPEVFRLDSRRDAAGAPAGCGGALRLLTSALGGLFPPLASGLRGFWRLLRAEVAKALGGDARSVQSDHPPASEPDRRPEAGAAVVLEGFEPRVWTNLVRNVLGVADAGGTAQAGEARRAAGHKQYVFAAKDSLLDDVLERRLGTRGPDESSDAPSADDADDNADDSADEADDGADSSTYRISFHKGAAHGARSAGADRAPGAAAGHAEDDPHDAGDREARRGLLTLMDDAFRREIARARARRRAQQEELERLEEEAARTEQFKPPAAFRATIIAFCITAFIAVASYVFLLDTFDYGGMDKVLRARLAIVVTALTWLVLQYPLAPRTDDDPRPAQSYLLRSAALVTVAAALAAVFAAPIAGFAGSGGPWLELVTLVPALVTLLLAWRVCSSEGARQRPAGRAVALAWAVCYLVVGLLLYANMGSGAAGAGDDVDRSIFNRWGWLRRFFEEYGDSLRYAAVAVAGFLLLLALVMLAVSDAGADRLRRRARARIRELGEELRHDESLPILRGLRVNWLGTAAALDYILRRGFPHPEAPRRPDDGLLSPLLRLGVRSREAQRSPPPPGWLFSQYERAVEAYSARRDARPGAAGWVRPETSTMVSRLDRDPLAAPGADPRWDFARCLRAGDLDHALAADSLAEGDGSLLDADIEFMGEIAPVAPTPLPLGLAGSGAAGLGHVAMHSTWWWPDGFGFPESPTPPRPAPPVRSTAGEVFLAVRLDVSDPVLERQDDDGPVPPAEPGDEPPPPTSPDDGLR